MATGVKVFPQLLKPIKPVEPNTDYDIMLVNMAISPRVTTIGNKPILDASISITGIPARILADGTVDQAPPNMHVHYSIGSACDEAKTNVRVRKMVRAIRNVLHDYINGV